MLAATYESGQVVFPTNSGQRTICPGCNSELVACCGTIVTAHWRHLSSPDCDQWAESPSPWHLHWQRYLQTLGAAVEVHIRKNGVLHRADAVLRNGTVVELQHSGLSVPEIRAREAFYGRMLWVFDARDAYANERFDLRPQKKYTSFRWKHPRKSVAYATSPVRLDLGEGNIFQVRKMSQETPCGGWGKLINVPALAAQDA